MVWASADRPRGHSLLLNRAKTVVHGIFLKGESPLPNSKSTNIIMSKLVILSGAGLSAESGVATFRDNNGLWEKHRFEDVCNFHTWQQNYDLVHRFYNQRRVQLGTVEPNAAHRQIAQWEATYKTVLLTQNVDDLLERGGCKAIDHLHGFLTRMRCFACGNRWSIGYTAWQEADRCPAEGCGNRSNVKPDVVFFGESAPVYSFLWDTMKSLERGDVLLVIGTTGAVLPVDSMARNANCIRILNNLTPSTEINDRNFDYVFYEPATKAIRKIDSLLKQTLGRPSDSAS